MDEDRICLMVKDLYIDWKTSGGRKQGERGSERERQTDRQRKTDRKTETEIERDTEKERQRERERSVPHTPVL